MQKTYLEVLNESGSPSCLHYLGVELMCDLDDELLDQLLDKFGDYSAPEDHVFLGRESYATIPIDIKLDKLSLSYMGNEILLPDGTTHLRVDLYHNDNFSSKYRTSKNIPVALKIDGTSLSVFNETGWKKLSNDYQDDGGNIYSLDFLQNSELIELPSPIYVIDEVIKGLDPESNGALLLDLYKDQLSILFDEKRPLDKLISLFVDNKVFKVYDDEDTYHDCDNQFNIKLNKLFANVVKTVEFGEVYNKTIEEIV